MPNGDLFLLVEVLIKVSSTLAIHLGDDTYESLRERRAPCLGGKHAQRMKYW